MKLSLKFRDETHHKNPLLRAKIPVTILGFPFLSTIVAGDSSDLSFSLRSNFSSGPTLSLSYHPTTTTSSSSSFPFSLSLKSGIGLFGSHHDSPLIFTASFASHNSLTPSFFLHLRPQFGNFFLSKSVSDMAGGVRVDGPPQNGVLGNWSESKSGFGDGFGYGSALSGVMVGARTSMPLAKRGLVSLRWGVSFPPEKGGGFGSGWMPMLVMNKVALERVEEEVRRKEEGRRGDEARGGDLEFLKGMCGWMRREVEELKRENRDMRWELEGVRMKGVGVGLRGRGEEREGGRKQGVAVRSGDGLSEFERWKKKGNCGSNGNGGCGGVVEENGHKDVKKPANRMSDMENELQKAIKAASC